MPRLPPSARREIDAVEGMELPPAPDGEELLQPDHLEQRGHSGTQQAAAWRLASKTSGGRSVRQRGRTRAQRSAKRQAGSARVELGSVAGNTP